MRLTLPQVKRRLRPVAQALAIDGCRRLAGAGHRQQGAETCRLTNRLEAGQVPLDSVIEPLHFRKRPPQIRSLNALFPGGQIPDSAFQLIAGSICPLFLTPGAALRVHKPGCCDQMPISVQTATPTALHDRPPAGRHT